MSWQEALHEVQQSSKLDPENPSRVLVNDKGRGDNFLNDTIKEILCSFVTLIGSYFATHSPSPPPPQPPQLVESQIQFLRGELQH